MLPLSPDAGPVEFDSGTGLLSRGTIKY